MEKAELERISEQLKSKQSLPAWLLKEVSLPDEIRLIRTALGMTQAQLAERVGVTQHAIAQIENSTRHDFQLSTLRKISEALGARFVAAIVPEEEISATLERKSFEAAERIISLTTGNTALELQLPDRSFIERERERLQREILEKYRSALWQKS